MTEAKRIPRYRVTVGEGSEHTFEMEVIDREDGPSARGIATASGKKYAEDHNLGDVPIQVELIS